MVTDELYYVDLLAELGHCWLNCDITCSPKLAVNCGKIFCIILLLGKVSLLTSISSESSPNLSSNALHITTNISGVVVNKL